MGGGEVYEILGWKFSEDDWVKNFSYQVINTNQKPNNEHICIKWPQ